MIHPVGKEGLGAQDIKKEVVGIPAISYETIKRNKTLENFFGEEKGVEDEEGKAAEH